MKLRGAPILQRRAALTQTSPFDVFTTADARSINKARTEHAASLGLIKPGIRVLEVGAGIGLHTEFLRRLGCNVLATDGNRDNVEEIRRRLPGQAVEILDLESPVYPDLRIFDVIYCYGVLYHLADPAGCLRRLADLCGGQIIVETVVALGRFEECYLLKDFPNNNNQAVHQVGCRPTRAWMMAHLRSYFGFAYSTVTQPDHPDFPTDWFLPDTRLLYRAIFVGSKTALVHARLVSELSDSQERYTPARTGGSIRS